MRQAFRPYSLVIGPQTMAAGVNVELKDTAGNLMECNYISLQVSGNSQRFHRMSANFPGLTTPSGNFDSVVDQVGDTASGVPSVYTIDGGEPGTMLLSDSDRVHSVNIKAAGGTAILILTYGQISVGNNLRDQERPRGD